MTENSINFKKLRETATTVLQGDYAVVVDKAEFKLTQKNSEPMWVLTLKVTAGPYTGRTIRHNLVLSSTHTFMVNRFFSHMAVLGLDASFFDANPSPDAVSIAVTGRHAIANLVESKSEFRGEKQSEVSELKPATGGVTVSVGAGATVSSSLPQASSLPAAVTVVTAPAGEQIAPPEDPF